jgi:hypothetical protein
VVAIWIAAAPTYVLGPQRQRVINHNLHCSIRSSSIQPSGIGGKKHPLSKNDAVEMDGTVVDTLPNFQFADLVPRHARE